MRTLLTAALLVPALVLAQAPAKLGYQGLLLKADGTPEVGLVSVQFALFDSAAGGTALWQETQSLALSDGLYSTFLGEVTPLPAGAFDGTERFLELAVKGAVLSPRQRINSVAYSLMAASARDVSGGTVDATSVRIGGVSVIDNTGKLAGPAAYSAGTGLALSGTTFSLGVVGVSNGGTGLSSGPSASGEYLRASGAGAWATGPIQPSDLPSLSGSYLDMTSAQTVAGTKTFSSPIAGSVTGSAASFTGSLAGDVTGTQGATVVGALLGLPMAATSPGTGQVLTWNGTTWAPASGGGSGTVTKVSSGLGLTGGPITDSGTLAIDPAVVPQLGAANTFTAGDQRIQTGAAIAKGLLVQGAASQTANLQEWQDSTGALLASVGPTGVFTGDGSGLTNLSAGPHTHGAADVTAGVFPIARGGTGADNAAGARLALGAATSGANSDITSLSGLTTGLSVAQGGTGGTTPALARASLGAAASGANSDITQLTGLTAVTSGSWQGSVIAATYGGTGLNTSATPGGGILVRNAAGTAWQPLAAGSAGQVLKINAGVPTWGTDNGVTSVATGSGLTGGPITTSGTIGVATGGIIGTHLADGAVAFAHWNSNGCTAGQTPQWNGAAWACALTATVAQVPQSNVITAAAPFGAAGTFASATIGADGRPIVSYYDGSNYDLKVLKCGNPSCTAGNTTTTLDSFGVVGQYTSIAIGTDGLPVIAYLDYSNGNLKVAKCGNNACSSGNTLRVVDSADDVGSHASITIGANGFPVIAYYDATSGNLKLALCGNADCSTGNTILTVDTVDDVGRYTSITRSAFCGVLVSYYDVTNRTLKVATYQEAACSPFGASLSTSTLDGGILFNVGMYTSIAIGVDGLPVISYYDVGKSDLKVIKATASGWGTPVGLHNDFLFPMDYGQYSSITINAAGVPAISHRDATNSALVVSTCTDVNCTAFITHTVDSPNVGQFTSITLGTDGLPLIAYYDSFSADLKVAKCANTYCAPNLGRR